MIYGRATPERKSLELIMSLQHITVARVYIVSLINFHAAYNPTAYSARSSLYYARVPPSSLSLSRSGARYRGLSSGFLSFVREKRSSRPWKIGWKKYSRTILLFSPGFPLPLFASARLVQFHREINYRDIISGLKWRAVWKRGPAFPAVFTNIGHFRRIDPQAP